MGDVAISRGRAVTAVGMHGEGAEILQMGSRVVMGSRCVGAWSIPGATEC